MNGCVNTNDGNTACFCNSDGCNSETKLSRDLTNIFEKSDDNELDLNTMGSHTTLKCWQCSTKATTFGFKFGKCPNDFGDETLLTDCKSNAFCLKTEYKGKKLIFLSVSLCLKKDIWTLASTYYFFTAGESLYKCGYNFEGEIENWEERFKENPIMNGNCTTTRANETYCFCDSYDGCNSSRVTQLSLFLFGVIVLTHLAF